MLNFAPATGWTLFTAYLLLRPAKGTNVERISRAFGGTELTDAAGHVMIFGVMTALWYIAFKPYTSPAMTAVGVSLLLGVGMELGQYFVPHRGLSLLDVVANCLGPVLVGGILFLFTR